MSQARVLVDIYEVAIQAGFWAAFLFPVVTALYWPWWQSWWGRNLVALDAAIALTLLSAVLQIEFGLVPGHTPGHFLLWTTVFSLSSVPLIIVWRGILTYLAQRDGERRDRDSAGQPSAD